jgi:hypothetical protein
MMSPDRTERFHAIRRVRAALSACGEALLAHRAAAVLVDQDEPELLARIERQERDLRIVRTRWGHLVARGAPPEQLDHRGNISHSKRVERVVAFCRALSVELVDMSRRAP